MYEYFIRTDDDAKPFVATGPDPALAHRGDCQRLLKTHQRHAAELFSLGGMDGLRQLDPRLLPRIADARTMRAAADDLRARGGHAPGPNGLRLEELDSAATWSLCRTLAQAIHGNTYRPGRDRNVRIPKEGRPGEFRELTLQNVEDRIVGRAVMLILQECTERVFSPFSFGFRRKRGPLEALATALALARTEARWFWAGDDVAKAFDRIPHARFLDACRRLFPADVVALIELISAIGTKRGLRQGSPASPLFANIFFDHFVDQPWRRQHPDLPLLRYADDLLLLCRDVEEAAAGYSELSQMALSAGTPLKGTAGSSIVSLRDGQSVTWLGFLIRREANHVAIRIASKAWDRLEWRLAKVHLGDAAPIRAVELIEGWLDAMGPCYQFEDRGAVIDRIHALAAAQAFEEIPGRERLIARWGAAHARWCRLYQHEASLLPSRLARVGCGEPLLMNYPIALTGVKPMPEPTGLNDKSAPPHGSWLAVPTQAQQETALA